MEIKGKLLKNTILLFVCTVFLGANAAFAEEQKDDFKFSGQVQVRTEMDARDFNNATSPVFFTSLRTTLGIEKTMFEKLKFFIQLRDSRIFGEEANTLTSLKNLDLHQGFVQVNEIFNTPLSVQAGRFEVNYGTQRFFGPVGWHYVGRSFDGLRVMYSLDELNFKTDVFAFTHTNSTGYIGNAVPALYQNLSPDAFNIYGFWTSAKASPALEGAVFAFMEDNSKKTDTGVRELARGTAGLNYKGEYGPFSSLVEAAYQFGTNKNLPVNAYLVSGQVFYAPGDFKFGLGTDILSGNGSNSPGTSNTFAVPYGTNHMFYGFMDYFIDIPGNTKGLGLNDFYFTSSWKSAELPLTVSLNLHHFMSDKPDAGGLNTYGQEADLTIACKLFDNTTLTWGSSLFTPGNLMKSTQFFGPERDDLSYWSYLMLSAGF